MEDERTMMWREKASAPDSKREGAGISCLQPVQACRRSLPFSVCSGWGEVGETHPQPC